MDKQERQKLIQDATNNYLLERRRTEDKKHVNQSEFDKILITLTTASFGVSVGFIKGLPFLNQDHTWVLILSWIFFILSTLSVLISYKFGVTAHTRQIEILDEVHKKGRKNTDIINKYNRITEKMNDVSGITFFIAIIFTLWYVIANLK